MIDIDKKTFLKQVTILVDTREKENLHILHKLDELNIKYESRKLDLGDYSFVVEDKDFSQSCVIERKADIDELYGNVMHDRERIEKEFAAAKKCVNQFVLLIEKCESMYKLKSHKVSKLDMQIQKRKVQNIGEHCYSTIKSWQSNNRYGFRTMFVSDNADTAVMILEDFYHYWRNYKEQTKNRKR